MPLDTVKLRSPFLPVETVERIEALGVRTVRTNLSTGEIEFQFIRTPLEGSWDSRISIIPKREDCHRGSSGRMEWHPSEPYIYVECSLAKVLFGQNVYGGPVDFQGACKALIELLEGLLAVQLPKVALWRVYRVDWAESYSLPFAGIQDFFAGIYSVSFPRRRLLKFGDNGVYVPGTTTTIKLYHKGPEFREHDSARLVRHFERQCKGASENAHVYATRKVAALQRLANRRLRVEVEIRAQRLDYDLQCKPRVCDLTEDYFRGVHDHEIERLFREGAKDIEIARKNDAVQERLIDVYGARAGNQLYGFWLMLATRGEERAKTQFKRPTFYRNRKKLKEAGVSWYHTDIQLIERQGALPSDFSPVRTDQRRCTAQVREKPASPSWNSGHLDAPLEAHFLRKESNYGNRVDHLGRSV
jgi:II/X family phage/plasmid replication protein